MTDNIVKLGEADIYSERRADFMRAVAQSFELYVKEHNEEPEAIVYFLCGLRQTSEVGWEVVGDSMDGMSSVLSLVAVHALAEAQRPLKPHD